jgi:hypothetical protein
MGKLDVDRLLALEDYAEFTGDGAQRNYLEALVLTAFLYEQRDRALLRRYIETERRQSGRRALAFRDLYRHDEEPFRREILTYVRHKSALTARDTGG